MSIRVIDISKTYKKNFFSRKSVEAVRNVNFSIDAGQIYALLGPNGAGKSSIIKMIAGLIIPSGGEIYLDSVKMSGRKTTYYKNISAMLEGTRNVYWRLNPMENLHYFANLRGVRSGQIKERVHELLENA